jgi:hypothetical protein
MKELTTYETEKLESEELSFLRRKEAKERNQLYKVVRAMMMLCFVCPFIVAWVQAINGVPDPFRAGTYFLSVLFLLVFAGIVIYVAYRQNLRRVQLDIGHGTKLIERTHVTRKLYMPQTNTWFFYLDSPTRLSIEVSEDDYQRMEPGDEISIEYTSYSRMYLGYF